MTARGSSVYRSAPVVGSQSLQEEDDVGQTSLGGSGDVNSLSLEPQSRAVIGQGQTGVVDWEKLQVVH